MKTIRTLLAAALALLTPALHANTFTVTNTNDSGAGTLRQAIIDAKASGGADAIAFDSVLSGQTIALTTSAGNIALLINDTSGLTIDASMLPAGIVIDGGLRGFALFYVQSGTLVLRGLTLAHGGGIGISGGGAIYNSSGCTVTLERCTLSDNRAGDGGGAIENYGTAMLTQCTLSGNQADPTGFGLGGAIGNDGTLTLTHCTLSGNSAWDGGAIFNLSQKTVNLAYTVIAANTASSGSGPDIDNGGFFNPAGFLNLIGVNFIGDIDSSRASGALLTGNAKLGSLAFNGGPTQTIALLAGSPARNAAVGSTITSDQRGFLIYDGTPDLGAFEAALKIAVEQPAGTDLPSGANIGFASTEVATGEADLVFTLKNSGEVAFTPTGATPVTLGGADAGQFSVTTQPTSPVATGGSTTFTVRFAPTSTGAKNATLSITRDATNQNPFTLALTGTGVDTLTVPPTITSPADGVRIFPTFDVTFTLPEASLADSMMLSFSDGTNTYPFLLGASAAPAGSYSVPFNASSLPFGTYALTLSYRDAADHPAATATLTGVTIRPPNSVNTVAFAQGAPAPGHGTNGLPDDAVLASFNTPATDDAGDVAFVAKWTSATGGKGTGLFLNDNCLAIVGGDAGAIAAGVKWKSFSDPVVEGGKLVSIAKLSNGATAVVCNFTGAALEKIALTSEVAADAGAAKFKSFKTVALRGGSIGFLGQLTGGTGASKVTAANDTAEWIRKPGAGLHLVYRDSFDLGGSVKVASFMSFQSGIGSPGQGRGWLSHSGSGDGIGLMLSLTTLTDKSKALVFGGYGGAFLARTDDIGTFFAPALARASFASFRYPAMNDALQTTFYATMKVGAGGVIKADAGGIFFGSANFSGSLARYALVARTDKPSSVLDANFSTLSDPVLSADGSVAFLATLKGGTAKGPLTKTLWWKPAGQPLALLAQGGQRPSTDLPALAQWKSFDSLAITDRGPIFAATLVPKKGAVTDKTASGVWACDFTGSPRLLFRTGDTIGGKTLKSFTLLKATVGNMGVTRSFNNTAQVVWLATFTDKSSAIITTEVP